MTVCHPPDPLGRRHVRVLYAYARKNLASATRLVRTARKLAALRDPVGESMMYRHSVIWFELFFEERERARSLRRELAHEAELETRGQFVRVQVYVKAIAFRPLGACP